MAKADKDMKHFFDPIHKMVSLFLLMVCFILPVNSYGNELLDETISLLPRIIDGGSWESPAGHLQGIACDDSYEYMYMSFTDRLIKIDMRTNSVVASVIGFRQGGISEGGAHLGDLAYYDGKIYASLEYKSMEKFYVAVFDCESITRMNMYYWENDITKTVFIKEAVIDYCDELDAGEHDNRADSKGHRYGCSGLDGVTFGKMPGGPEEKVYLFVAYGIYENTERNDNDYNIILVYDPETLHPIAFDQDSPHIEGPDLYKKLYVYTGNTSYGIQNLEFDKDSGDIWIIVNKGSKEKFPNYTFYLIDGSISPQKKLLHIDNINYGALLTGDVLELKKEFGETHYTGITGIMEPIYKATNGFVSLGNDYFYIADSGKDEGKQFGHALLMKLDRTDWSFVMMN